MAGMRGQANRLWRLASAPASLVPTYVGIVVVLVGFGLIALTWAEVAALTNVALQLPYLVSAGFSGLGLIMVGVVLVGVAARRQDSAERGRQMDVLVDALAELRRAVGGGRETLE